MTSNTMTDQLVRTTRSDLKPGAKLLSISNDDLYMKSNYQDFQRFQEVDLALAADAEATLPSLIEAVKRLITADRRRVFQDRGAKIRRRPRAGAGESAPPGGRGLESEPDQPRRITYELWEQIKNKDWSSRQR